MRLGLGLGLSLSRAGGASSALALLPASVPAPYTLAGPTSTQNYQNTGGYAHYAQASGNAQELAINVNTVDGSCYYLRAYNGDSGLTLIERKTDTSESTLIGFTSVGGTGIDSTMQRHIKVERLSSTSNRISGWVGVTTFTITIGVFPAGNTTYAGLRTGSGVTSLVIGQLDTPLAISSATFNASRTVDLAITYTGTPNSYEYQINGGSWADASNYSNASAGVAVIRIPAISTGLNGTSPTFTLRQKNLTSVTASWSALYIPTVASYGLNLSYPEVGGNGYQVRNGALYGEWQDTVGNAVYTNVANPTYIGRDYMPLLLPPGGSWRHLIPFMGPSGTRIRVRANNTSAAFSLEPTVGQSQSSGSGGGFKWIDCNHTYSDAGASDDSAYLGLTVTALGAPGTTWEAYPIDGSGNALESGFFTAQYIADCARFKCLRFLNWVNGNGNNSTTFDWTDRMTGTDWRLNGGAMPYTRMIELWQACGESSAWNIPWKATNTFIDTFADLLADSVPTGKLVYTELANEVHNSNFPVWTIAKDEGIAAGLTTPGGATPSTNHDYAMARYSQRHSEVMARVAARFALKGKTSQLVRVANLQPVPGNFDYVANNYSLDANTDAYSCSIYIGYDANNQPTPTTDPNVVFARYRTGDSYALDSVMAALSAMKVKANSKGKRFIVYEAGVEKMNGSSASLQKSVNRDARMKTLMLDFFDGHSTRAGDLINVYRDDMRITDFGGYGFREYFFQTRANAPKMDALLTAMGL